MAPCLAHGCITGRHVGGACLKLQAHTIHGGGSGRCIRLRGQDFRAKRVTDEERHRHRDADHVVTDPVAVDDPPAAHGERRVGDAVESRDRSLTSGGIRIGRRDHEIRQGFDVQGNGGRHLRRSARREPQTRVQGSLTADPAKSLFSLGALSQQARLFGLRLVACEQSKVAIEVRNVANLELSLSQFRKSCHEAESLITEFDSTARGREFGPAREPGLDEIATTETGLSGAQAELRGGSIRPCAPLAGHVERQAEAGRVGALPAFIVGSELELRIVERPARGLGSRRSGRQLGVDHPRKRVCVPRGLDRRSQRFRGARRIGFRGLRLGNRARGRQPGKESARDSVQPRGKTWRHGSIL